MIAELQPRAIAYEQKFDQRIGLKASYLSKQIDTHIGERLSVRLSLNNYEIKDNLIYGQDMDDPFTDVIKRGIEYRQKVEGENRPDKRREEAELTGFLKVQKTLCDINTPFGTMMLSISPQGGKDSVYQHNFYDIFTLKKDKGGRRFVEARRYSSALTIAEYKDKLKPLFSMEENVDDAYLLSHPVRIGNGFFQDADDIHSYLHKDHNVTELDKFQEIIGSLDLLKREYYRTRDKKILDAIMNKADEMAGLVEFKKDKYSSLIDPSIELKIGNEIDFYGGQKVRQAATGCGSSGGLNMNKDKNSPFSVSDFGNKDDLGDREFDCPECKKMNRRPYNKTITNCQHCGSSKVAC